MKYSVALCSYNGEKYLAEQLQSIIDQTIRPSQIVICDDCSIDNTKGIILYFIKNNPNIDWKFKINEKNIGYVRNFEQAIQMCEEEIVFLSDQDDIWYKNKAEIILNRFSDNKYFIYFTDGHIVDEKLQKIGMTLFERRNFNTIKQEKFHTKNGGTFMLLSDYLATGATMAFKKKMVEPILPMPECNHHIHDSWIITVGKCMNLVDFINIPLISYRQHSAQSIGSGLNTTLQKTRIVKKTRSQIMIERLSGRMNKEVEIVQFLEKNNLVKDKIFKLLRDRICLYENIINKHNKNFLYRMYILNYKYLKYHIIYFNDILRTIKSSLYYILRK